MATNTYVALATQTLGSAVSSVTFSSIPQGYTDLVMVASVGASSSGQGLTYQLNGDTGSNYSVTGLRGNGSSASSFRQSNNTEVIVSNFSEPPTTGTGTYIVNFQNYSNTATYKTSISRGNAAAGGVDTFAGLWRSTAAITSVLIKISSGTMNIGSTFTVYGIKAWSGETGTKATGGYVYTDSTYCYHAFQYSGTFTPTQSLTADILVVGGGGGSSGNWGGGGGAGGFLAFTSQSLTATPYTCTVGAGGAGAQYTPTSGGNSVFGALTTAVGGGNGGSAATAGGGTGGSGGGGTYDTSAGNGTSGQGNAGGTGQLGGGGNARGGGGGGAGAAGGAANASIAGAGGVGIYSTFTDAIGAATGLGDYVASHYYFAGGGGGGGANSTTENSNIGGYGGGGNGNRTAPASGKAGTGGGGGGGAGNALPVGGAGGSGIVIIRYPK